LFVLQTPDKVYRLDKQNLDRQACRAASGGARHLDPQTNTIRIESITLTAIQQNTSRRALSDFHRFLRGTLRVPPVGFPFSFETLKYSGGGGEVESGISERHVSARPRRAAVNANIAFS